MSDNYKILGTKRKRSSTSSELSDSRTKNGDVSQSKTEKIGGVMSPLMKDVIKEKKGTELHPYYKLAGKKHNNDFCYACGDSGKILCCDMCTASFHFMCHDPPLSESDIPLGQWFCHACRYTEETESSEDSKSPSTSSSEAQSPVEVEEKCDKPKLSTAGNETPIITIIKSRRKRNSSKAAKRLFSEIGSCPVETKRRKLSSSQECGLEGCDPGLQIQIVLQNCDGLLNEFQEQKTPPVLIKKISPKKIDKAEKKIEAESVRTAFHIITKEAAKTNAKQFELPTDIWDREKEDVEFPGTDCDVEYDDFTEEDLISLPPRLCYHCKGSRLRGEMISCDYCPAHFHLNCLYPPMSRLLEQKWMCPLHPHKMLSTAIDNLDSLTGRLQWWKKLTEPVDIGTVQSGFIENMRKEGKCSKLHIKRIIKIPGTVRYHYEDILPQHPPIEEVVPFNELSKDTDDQLRNSDEHLSETESEDWPGFVSDSDSDSDSDWLGFASDCDDPSNCDIISQIKEVIAQRIGEQNNLSTKNQSSDPIENLEKEVLEYVKEQLAMQKLLQKDAELRAYIKQYNYTETPSSAESKCNIYGMSEKNGIKKPEIVNLDKIVKADVFLPNGMCKNGYNLSSLRISELSDDCRIKSGEDATNIPDSSADCNDEMPNVVNNELSLSCSNSNEEECSEPGSSMTENETECDITNIFAEIRNILLKEIDDICESTFDSKDSLDQDLKYKIAERKWQSLIECEGPCLMPGVDPYVLSAFNPQNVTPYKQAPLKPPSCKVRAALCPLSNKAPLAYMSNSTLYIGAGLDNDVCLLDYGTCEFVSEKHATIVFDKVTRNYELINYSGYSTRVDNAVYTLNMNVKRTPCEEGTIHLPEFNRRKRFVRKRRKNPPKITPRITRSASKTYYSNQKYLCDSIEILPEEFKERSSRKAVLKRIMLTTEEEMKEIAEVDLKNIENAAAEFKKLPENSKLLISGISGSPPWACGDENKKSRTAYITKIFKKRGPRAKNAKNRKLALNRRASGCEKKVRPKLSSISLKSRKKADSASSSCKKPTRFKMFRFDEKTITQTQEDSCCSNGSSDKNTEGVNGTSCDHVPLCKCPEENVQPPCGQDKSWEEATAVLQHGSYIKFGCIEFVFCIVGYPPPPELRYKNLLS